MARMLVTTNFRVNGYARTSPHWPRNLPRATGVRSDDAPPGRRPHRRVAPRTPRGDRGDAPLGRGRGPAPMTEPLPLDELLPRLRDRASEPDRRTSSRPSQMVAGVRAMDLAGLLTMGRSLASQLRGVVAANQAGTADAAGHAAALELERQMTTPAESVLPGPADEAS